MSEAPNESGPAQATRIAVVEDERDILDILQYNLQREGFEVDCYERG